MNARIPLIIVIFFLFYILYVGYHTAQEKETLKVVPFSSEKDFAEYIEQGAQMSYYSGFFGTVQTRAMTEETTITAKLGEGAAAGEYAAEEPYRYSETNVQVAGIDEPDIVKTDGKRIYFSPYRAYWWWRGYVGHNTKIIQAFPPSTLNITSEISKGGELLLENNVLIILSDREVNAYDVSDASNPSEKWTVSLNGSLVDARLYNNRIYLVLRKDIYRYSRCPIPIAAVNNLPIKIKCTQIYHPIAPISVNTVYTILVVDPANGNVDDAVSFVGVYGSSIVYMSTNAIYVTYPVTVDPLKILTEFFEKECADILPEQVIQDIKKISTYDISPESKMNELERILQEYINSLDEDERLRIENELENRMSTFMKEHMREFEKTGITKVKLDENNLDIYATGSVPGHLLNQFSMDEYEGYLRVATTVGGWDSSANDVYVLDDKLNIVGSVKDLGLAERIYSVRFIGDRGYVVTFRQVDPFYIIDLSNPTSPQLKGELKIPGYSSYLHPIEEHLILGIGKEGSKVKLSLFDVSDASNPIELDKYILNEYWSDVLSTHHAFLLDKEKGVFFLPGGKGAYIFSYDNNKLKLIKAVETMRARRAIYINNYLYVISDNEISVLDEDTWNKVNELKIAGEVESPFPFIK